MNPAMRSQYHNVHHPNIPTPSTRRGGMPPIAPNAQSQREAQFRQKQDQDAREAREARENREKAMAQRRASKPSDKNMPEGIDEFIIGDGIQQYKRMREFERKVDAMMMRKRLEMQDTRHNTMKRHKRMRIWISNTYDIQSRQGEALAQELYDFSESSQGVYRLKIEGRLLDDDDDVLSEDGDSDKENGEKDKDAMDHDAQPAQQPVKPAVLQPRTKLSHFFKAITVDLDRSKTGQSDLTPQVEWKKPAVQPNAVVLPPGADFDSLEFERQIDHPTNCTIHFYRDEQPERFLLSDPLAELLDSRVEDRRSTFIGLWDYIKAMNLQQDDEKRAVQCDDRLRK
ncbi:MAG: hypothetical protein Q9181_003982, partial [Wetmoreana brouardii]